MEFWTIRINHKDKNGTMIRMSYFSYRSIAINRYGITPSTYKQRMPKLVRKYNTRNLPKTYGNLIIRRKLNKSAHIWNWSNLRNFQSPTSSLLLLSFESMLLQNQTLSGKHSHRSQVLPPFPFMCHVSFDITYFKRKHPKFSLIICLIIHYIISLKWQF